MCAMQIIESPIRNCVLGHELFCLFTQSLFDVLVIMLPNYSGLSLNIYYEAKFGIRRLTYELPKGLILWSPIRALRENNYSFLFWLF